MIRLIDLLKARATYLTDFIDLAEYFFRDPLIYDQDGIRKYLKDEIIWNVLAEVTGKFENMKNFDEAALEDIIRNLAAVHNLSAGKLIHPLRLAISGRTATPGLFEVMALLGKETVLRRLTMFLKSRFVFEQSIIQGRR